MVAQAWRDAVDGRQVFDAEYRVGPADGATVWVRSIAQCAEDAPPGGRVRWRGLTECIQPRQERLESRELVLMEVEHRARNLITVLHSLVLVLPKDDPAAFASALQSHLVALANAHDLLAERSWAGVQMRTVVERELGPFEGRVSAVGADVEAPVERVQDLCLVLHELATNSAKYGALSQHGGRVSLEWRVEGDRLELLWAEAGGPPVAAPLRKGFGLKLIERAACRGKSDGVTFDWAPQGLQVSLALSARR